ncbi:MAG: PP2C family protein-serine/threonine phosphatase, partial [Terriglobales bacterium]
RRNGLQYINAGHVPPLLIRNASGKYELLEEGGLVVGLFPQTEYRRGSIKLEPGDVLVCCTDGILEANDSREDEFGVERLAAAVARHRSKSAQNIVDSVLEEVNQFAAGGTHVDDKVLMVMKVTREAQPQTALSGALWSRPTG